MTTIANQIIRELDQLPPELQRRVLDFAQALALSLPKGVPGKELLRFAGSIAPEDIAAMEQAIQAGCEKVDANEW
jgi:hypothetical protein